MFGLTCAKKYGGVYVPPHQAVIHQFAREMLAGGGKMILGSDFLLSIRMQSKICIISAVLLALMQPATLRAREVGAQALYTHHRLYEV